MNGILCAENVQITTYRRLFCINVRYTRNNCMSKSCCHFWDEYSTLGSIWLSVKGNIWLRTEINKFDFAQRLTKLHAKRLSIKFISYWRRFFYNFSIEIKMLLTIPNHNHGSFEQFGATFGRIVVCYMHNIYIVYNVRQTTYVIEINHFYHHNA